MSGLLTKKVVLLELEELDDDYAGYAYRDDEGEDVLAVAFERDVYKDFGSPQQITVTIVPGDTLNEVTE